MMNRFKATIAIAALSLLSLTACGEEVKNAAEGAKDTVGQTAQSATEGAKKAGEGAMKAGDGAMKATTEGAQKAGEGAMKAGEGAMKATTSAKDAVAGGVGGILSLKDSIPNLKDSAASALTAVKAGDFKTAQAEVTKLQESWGKVSEIVKKQPGGSFEKISTTLKTVQGELKAPSPDKTKIMADLQSLSSSVTGLASLK
jgi:phage-related protein